MSNDKAIRQTESNSPLRGYRLFRIFGFEVKLDLSWLLLGLLITWTLARGLFPMDYPNLTESTYWWMGFMGALGILFSIVFHELSHSLVSRYYGLPIRGITLFIFGGMAEMEKEPASPKVEFLMAVAGPLASFFLGLVFFILTWLFTFSNVPTPVIGVFHYLAVINVVLAVFNLVPAFPLDGGRMLRAALWQWKKNLHTATRIASTFGTTFGLVLIILGVLGLFQGNIIGGMWWILIGIFLRGAASASYRQMVFNEALSNKPVRHFMKTDPIVVPPALTVDEVVENYVYQYHYKMFPVVDGDNLVGCVTTRQIKDIPRERWRDTTVGDIATHCSPDNTIPPDKDTAELVSAMARPGASSRFMVVEAGRLLGVVSLKDLTEFISLKLELESDK